MNLRPTTLALLFLFSTALSAQKNYKAATITRKDHSTATGFINYREWLKNPVTIEFSNSADGSNSQTLGTKDLFGFEVTGYETYEAYPVLISMGNVQVNRLSLGKDSSSRSETVFLKVIERGKISLYRYADQLKERFYMKTADGSIVELKYFVYTDPERDTRVVDDKEYINQLINAGLPVTEDFKLQAKINGTPYREEPLQRIIRSINNNGEHVKVKTKAGIHPMLGAGAAFSSYSFRGDRGIVLPADKYNFTSSTSPVIFGGMNIYINPKTAKLFIRGDLGWFNNTHNGTATSSDYSYNYTWTYHLKYSVIGIFLGAGYNFVKTSNLSAYFSLGPSLYLMSVSTNKEHESRQWVINPSMKDEYDLKPPSTEGSAVNLELRAGVTISRHIDIAAILNSMKGRVITTTTFGDQSTIFQFRVGYIF